MVTQDILEYTTKWFCDPWASDKCTSKLRYGTSTIWYVGTKNNLTNWGVWAKFVYVNAHTNIAHMRCRHRLIIYHIPIHIRSITKIRRSIQRRIFLLPSDYLQESTWRWGKGIVAGLRTTINVLHKAWSGDIPYHKSHDDVEAVVSVFSQNFIFWSKWRWEVLVLMCVPLP